VWEPLMRKRFELLTDNLTESRQVDFYATFLNCLLQKECDLTGTVYAHYPEYEDKQGQKLLIDL